MPPPTGRGPLANLEVRLAAGVVHADPEQRRVAERLQALHDALAVAAAHRPAGLLRLLGLGRKPDPAPPGVYITMNGRVFAGDRVRKNRQGGVFEEI